MVNVATLLIRLQHDIIRIKSIASMVTVYDSITLNRPPIHRVNRAASNANLKLKYRFNRQKIRSGILKV